MKFSLISTLRDRFSLSYKIGPTTKMQIEFAEQSKAELSMDFAKSYGFYGK
jgi:hypothetical protein